MTPRSENDSQMTLEGKMNLQSRVCEILEIEQPIVLAGMGGASSPALAAAVSNAGGLGVLLSLIHI